MSHEANISHSFAPLSRMEYNIEFDRGLIWCHSHPYKFLFNFHQLNNNLYGVLPHLLATINLAIVYTMLFMFSFYICVFATIAHRSCFISICRLTIWWSFLSRLHSPLHAPKWLTQFPLATSQDRYSCFNFFFILDALLLW